MFRIIIFRYKSILNFWREWQSRISGGSKKSEFPTFGFLERVPRQPYLYITQPNNVNKEAFYKKVYENNKRRTFIYSGSRCFLWLLNAYPVELKKRSSILDVGRMNLQLTYSIIAVSVFRRFANIDAAKSSSCAICAISLRTSPWRSLDWCRHLCTLE